MLRRHWVLRQPAAEVLPLTFGLAEHTARGPLAQADRLILMPVGRLPEDGAAATLATPATPATVAATTPVAAAVAAAVVVALIGLRGFIGLMGLMGFTALAALAALPGLNFSATGSLISGMSVVAAAVGWAAGRGGEVIGAAGATGATTATAAAPGVAFDAETAAPRSEESFGPLVT